MNKEQNSKNQYSHQLNIAGVSGSYFELVFGNHLKAQMIIEDGKLKVTAAVNGWGDAVDLDTISFVHEEPKYVKEIKAYHCPKCGSRYVVGQCWALTCPNEKCGYTPKP